MKAKTDNLFFLFGSILVIICFLFLTFAHIIFFDELSYSNYNYLPVSCESRVVFLIIDYVLFFYFVHLIYFSIKKIIFNARRERKSHFFYVSILISLLFLTFYNPISIFYLFNSNIYNYVVMWDLTHFIGVIFIVVYLLKIYEKA